MNTIEHIEKYRGKRVLVLGLARSGLAAMRLLRDAGSSLAGADENASIEIPAEFSDSKIYRGTLGPEILDGIEEIIVSPGIPVNHPLMIEAERRGIERTSELELGYRFAKGHLVAVTGTNGKSTTATMIGEMLKASGREAIVCGNVGVPFCSVAQKLGREGFYVLEVSSFQLETISLFRAEVAGILNLTPDHLDRYDSVEEYYRFKERIIENSGPEDFFFFNAQDPRCSAAALRFCGRSIPFSSAGPLDEGAFLEGEDLVRYFGGRREKVISRSKLGVQGLHNVENALAAIASLTPFMLPVDALRSALSSFRGLPHRMEFVAEVRGVSYFNDSKGTNVEATLMTLKGLERPTVLIAGGHDKGGDFTKLIPVLGNIKAVVTIGEAAPLIEEALSSIVPVARAATMKDAVEAASRTAQQGDYVVLSPACASFDMFRNFEHRGEVFKECVLSMQK